jgi:diaminohydroxyphosphoribosylaminopyrimidine deaminase / 5-amino-6-(5-phosphoribosylamino)uracil reductase
LVAPVILGSGKTGLSLAPIARLSEAQRPATNVYVLSDGDVLFDCQLKG